VTSISDSAFQGCTGLEVAAEARGFATVVEWGRYCFVVNRRVSVLACVAVGRRQIFDAQGQEELVSALLVNLAYVPDDVLRIIVGFVA